VDKATDTKVDTGVETMKCIALLRNIITDGEGLREFSSNDCSSLDANGVTEFNKSRIHNSVTASVKQPRVLFCEFFHIPSGSVTWREEAYVDLQ
jgi:hypothetical protein